MTSIICVQYINDGELSYFNRTHSQNTADEPGGDCNTVVDCADSIVQSNCQLVKQDQDDFKVAEPSPCNILTKSAAEQVEAALGEDVSEGIGGNRLTKCDVEYVSGNRLTKSELEDVSVGTGNRLTKSASWFNSLSRRASRKTPLKKRSFPGCAAAAVEKQESDEREEGGSRDTSRLRLNK